MGQNKFGAQGAHQFFSNWFHFFTGRRLLPGSFTRIKGAAASSHFVRVLLKICVDKTFMKFFYIERIAHNVCSKRSFGAIVSRTQGRDPRIHFRIVKKCINWSRQPYVVDADFMPAAEMNMYLSGKFLEEAFWRALQMSLAWRENRMHVGSARYFPSFLNSSSWKRQTIVLLWVGFLLCRILRFYVFAFTVKGSNAAVLRSRGFQITLQEMGTDFKSHIIRAVF